MRTFAHICFLTGFFFAGIASALPYEGQELKVLAFRDQHSQAVEKHLEAFEKMTGAKVVLDRIASQSVATKTITDQLSGGSYDLYTVDEPFIPKLSEFFVPVNEWPETKMLKKPDFGSFVKAAVAGGRYLGKSFGVPINSNVYMFIYRQDLFADPKEQQAFAAKYGYPLEKPKTLKQMLEVAEFFNRPPKMYGFAPFTKKSEGTTVEAIWLLRSFGIHLFDPNVKANANPLVDFSPASVAKAFQFYKDLMKFSPRGSKSWHHPERMASYSRGKIAQMMTWPAFIKGLEDPNKSLVVGKTAYGLPPHAPQGVPAPVAGTWTIALSKKTKVRALAAEFAFWWSSFQAGKTLVPKGMNPVRKDLLQDKQLVASNPWFPSIMNNLEKAVVRPRFPKYKEVSDRISTYFTAVVSGQMEPEEGATQLKKDLIELVGDPLKVSKR